MTQAADFGQVINVTVVGKFKRNIPQQQLNSSQIFILNTKLERLLSPFILDFWIGSEPQKILNQPSLHLFILPLSKSPYFLSSDPLVVLLAHCTHKVKASEAISVRIPVIEVIFPCFKKVLKYSEEFWSSSRVFAETIGQVMAEMECPIL